MASEYGEPWSRQRKSCFLIVDKRGEAIAETGHFVDAQDEVAKSDDQVADRIVACVNAMAGIKDPSAVAEVLRLVGEWQKATHEMVSQDRCVDDLLKDSHADDGDCLAAAESDLEDCEMRENTLRQALLAAARKMKESTDA